VSASVGANDPARRFIDRVYGTTMFFWRRPFLGIRARIRCRVYREHKPTHYKLQYWIVEGTSAGFTTDFMSITAPPGRIIDNRR